MKMGHSQGKISINKRPKSETDALNDTFDPNLPAPELTEREIEMLREMWNILNKDIAKVGVVAFIDLFDSHPEVKDVFMAFRTEETSKLEYDHVLRAHALRVMGTVEKCIYRLDNPEKFQTLLMELGTRHQSYSVKIPYVDLMGPQFIASIKPHLENLWTEEAEQAWENLFKLICYHMKKGICSV